MRVFFWNIHEVRKAAGKRALRMLVKEFFPDILCLAEPMVQVSRFPALFFNKLGYSFDFIHNNRQNKVPNLWIIWKCGIARPIVKAMSEQHISVECDWPGSKVGLSFVHASSFKVVRRQLWLELESQVSSAIPWSVLGDFNATLLSNEKRGSGTFNLGSAAEIQAMIDACLLLPISSTGKKFTWTNNRRRGHVATVFDRSFCNEKWIDFFRNVMQRVLLSSVSDHAPLLVISDIVSKSNNIPFRFHGFWMENENFLPVVDEAWKMQIKGDPIYVLSAKLKRVKGVLKVWAHYSFPNINMELERATKALKSIQDSIEESSMSDDLFNKEADAKTALLIASRRHEALWAEKAKLRWVKNGDCNSKLFHLSVKMRRARNQISALKREDGSWVLDQRGIAEYSASFFEKFHEPTSIIEHPDLLDCIPKILSNEDVASLEAILGREEIKKAVWDMDPDSSPGPDGFPGKFFRKCWEIVETDFGKTVVYFFQMGYLPKGINNCSISLIPKSDGVSSLDKFRPICMGNFFCKILSKIMSSRLMPLLPRLVSDEQGAFQKGKIISSNISLASELENLMHSAVRGGGMGLKLDVQKAYDSLSWKFLFASLVKFGFSDEWISWIQLLLSSSRLSVLVNGGPVGFFPVGKGLRQGDPISPFLFILAEEVFCRGLKLLVRDGKLKSLPGPRGVSIPSHLFFADDIFIFMNASAKYVKNLQDFLEKYQAFSGQNFNLDKSSLFFGKVAPHRKQYISSLLGIKSERLPTKYLGVEIFKGRVRGSHLLPLLDKIKSKLAGWKGKLLSMVGRVELVRSVISSIPVHNFAVYWWPDHSIKLVERWMRNFIWSGDMEIIKKIVVNWGDVCKPKQEGGLGIRRLRDVNFACLAKLTW
ncbi:uncharacterized protein LOC122064826 [Macadamia integrifolia]|uniref:uncharacterized protein LOC122064826 n=1 Tax=Macadamia integrifolia TaxID=60698 RepID=UPI001C4E720C|nr:uncharacterized protein LOC122064826 [Macadamia integrifolia]